jgi:hypothetical protein
MDPLLGSSFGLLNTTSLELVLEGVGADDALCAALTCSTFHRLLLAQLERQLERTEYVQANTPRLFVPRATEARTLTSVNALSASPARLHWAYHLGENALGVVGAGPAGPTWLLNWDANTFRLLAVASMSAMKWARAQRIPCPWDARTCAYAAASGRLEVLSWAQGSGCPWDESTCSMAAFGGHLNCLKYARQRGCPWDEQEVVGQAAAGGWLAVLRWATARIAIQNGGGVSLTGPAARRICPDAARHGHLHVLQWAREGVWSPGPDALSAGIMILVRIPWDAHTCSKAALGGQGRVIEWARAQTPACEWDSGTCAMAAFGGHLPLLQWLRQKDCPWDWLTCYHAAHAGSLECLSWAHVHNADWGDDRIVLAAAIGGHTECLRYARTNGCGADARACAAAAQGGHLECLQAARALGCAWAADTCAMAALGGHQTVLEWARAQHPPCPWDLTTCANAARGGHLALLQWARGLPEAERAPWDGSTIDGGLENGHTQLVEWALANGCPVPAEVSDLSASDDSDD